jgi:hypothetical protein
MILSANALAVRGGASPPYPSGVGCHCLRIIFTDVLVRRSPLRPLEPSACGRQRVLCDGFGVDAGLVLRLVIAIMRLESGLYVPLRHVIYCRGLRKGRNDLTCVVHKDDALAAVGTLKAVTGVPTGRIAGM